MNFNRNEWLQERRKGIGGSDVAAILGMSKWKTPLDVYLDKTGQLADTPDNAPMLWGRNLEPVVRQHYSDVTGRTVRVPNEILRHPEYEFMLANLDGVTNDGRVLEVKTARTGDEWGEEGTDQVPAQYLLQVQHYMAVTGMPVADVAVLIGGQDFRLYHVEEDPELHGILIEREGEFWNHHVIAGVPPEPVTYTDMIASYGRKSVAEEVEADTNTFQAVLGLKSIKQEIARLEQEEENLKAIIFRALGSRDTLVSNGKTLATWKESKPRQTIDSKTLQAAYPEIYRQFLKTGEPSRRFLLK